MKFLVLICFVPYLVNAEYSYVQLPDYHSHQDYSYEDQEHWGGLCFSGHRQSPIGLYRESALEENFTPLKFSDYDTESFALIQNTGHYVKVRLTNTIRPTLVGGGLPEHYTLDHIHFHWESEHTIEDFRYPLELHLVHYATATGNLQNSTKFAQGIAVLAVLFDLSPDDDELIKPFLDALDNVRGRPTEEKPLENFRISDFLPRDMAGFYRYDGSLTTPTCDESVVWTVFTNTLRLSEKQLGIIKSMRDINDQPIVRNNRMPQPVNSRIIFRKVSPLYHDGAESIFSSTALITLMLSILIEHSW